MQYTTSFNVQKHASGGELASYNYYSIIERYHIILTLCDCIDQLTTYTCFCNQFAHILLIMNQENSFPCIEWDC